MSSRTSRQPAIHSSSTGPLLLLVAAVLAGGPVAGCMRDTITGGVVGAGAGATGGTSGRDSASAGNPSAGGAGASGASEGGGGVGGRAGMPAAGSTAGSEAGAGGSAGSGGAVGAGAAAAAAGSGGAAAAAAGSGGTTAGASGSSGEVARGRPVERDGKYILSVGELSIEIDPEVGGRISKCQFEGQNLLTGPEVDPINYGSTFWPSPQQRWNWPPVPEIDSQPYTAALSGETLELKSRVGERAKVEVTKRFTALPEQNGLEIEYELANRDSAAVAWAPWEITRVPANGLTFFPSGAMVVNAQLPVVTMGETTWYSHDPSKVGSGQKFSADGEGGWLAHVAGDTLLLKSFPDVEPAMQAPAPEAEIAIYAAAGYVELEPQGPYTMLMPGASVRWSVRWLVRKLPDGVTVEVGNAQLLEFAKATAAAAR